MTMANFPAMSSPAAQAENDEAQTVIPTIAAPTEVNNQALGEPHIRLRLDEQTLAVISTSQAQEVLVVPQQRLTVMPNMPAAVVGLLNHRSRIFWVLDLPQLCGLAPLDPRSLEYHLAILRIDDKSVGLAVRQVVGVTRFPEIEIQSPMGQKDIDPSLVPYLRGYMPQAEGILLVLEAAAIAAYSGQQP